MCIRDRQYTRIFAHIARELYTFLHGKWYALWVLSGWLLYIYFTVLHSTALKVRRSLLDLRPELYLGPWSTLRQAVTASAANVWSIKLRKTDSSLTLQQTILTNDRRQCH